jgi:DNA-binding CsgD family transcriptional regulator
VGPLSDLAADRLVALSGGRADDLAVLFAALDPAQLRDPRIDVPPSVTSQALGSLGPPMEGPTGAVVAAMVVLGDDALVPFVMAVSGLATPEATVAVDELETHPDVVVADGPGGRRVAFARPLCRAAAYHDLAPAHRRELHLRAAELLHAPAALRHLAAATSGADSHLAERIESEAAAAASGADWPAAASWWLTASRLRGDDVSRRADLVSAADALLIAGDAPGSAALVDDLGELGRDGAAHLLAGRLAAIRGDLTAGEAHLVAAWSGCDPSDDRVASLAASHLAAICFADARGDDAVLWAARALERSTPEAARRDVDPLTRLLLSYGLAGRVDEGIELAGGRGVVDSPSGGDGVLGLAGLQLVSGHLDDALAGLEAVSLRAATDGPQQLWWYGQAWRSFGAVNAGRWDEALAYAADAARAADVGAWSFAALGHFAPTVVATARGQIEVAQAALESARQVAGAAGSPRLLRLWLAALEAWMAEAAGDHEAVLIALGPWHPDELVRATGPLLPCVGTMASRALERLGRLAECDATVDALGPPGGPIDAAWRAAMAGTRLAHHGDIAGARARYDAALETLPAQGYLLDRSRLHYEVGTLLRRAGKRRLARGHLDAAAAGFEALGAIPFLARCERELSTSASTARSRRVPGQASLLTPAEQAVAVLVGAGRTNRQVATELFVSPKTVEYHLGNVYRKLGVANRTQLATRLDVDRSTPSGPAT